LDESGFCALGEPGYTYYQKGEQKRLQNDGEWSVGSREWGNVELLTLTLSFPSNRQRYYLEWKFVWR